MKLRAFHKIVIFSGLLAAAVISLTNCRPEIVPGSLTESGIARITVSAEDTRTANSGMSTVWSEDDTLSIFTATPDSGFFSQGKASIEDGIGSSTAVFSFNYTDAATAPVDWFVLYPYNPDNTTPTSLAVDLGATSVTQNGYDDKAHLAGSICPLYGIAEGKTVNDAVVPVHHLCSFIEFDVTNDTGVSLIIKSVKLDATEEVAGSFIVDLHGSETVFTTSSASKTATVNISDPASLDNDSVAKAYLPIKPYKHNISDEFNVTVTLEADSTTVEVPFNLTLSTAENGTFSAGLIKPVGLSLTSDMLYGPMKITGITPRYHSATVTGEAAFVGTSIIQYRKSGASSWQSASSSTSGGTVSADITGLAENTTYEVRISAGSVDGPSETFTTKKEIQLYNMSFENWCKEGMKWCCYGDASHSEKIWANTDEATADYGKDVVSPEESDVVSGKAVKLISQVLMGQLVTGCLFTGLPGCINVHGITATLNMGIPFTDRPTALQGWAKYISETINYAKAPNMDKIGTPDSGRLFVLLTDWDSPFSVTPSNTRIDFNHNTNDSIIGFGEMLFEDTEGIYKLFTIPIEYYSDRTPKYVVICGTSSALGVFFTGGEGSTLYLDEFRFIYD
ncbi:MAG: PCMD domain-containing protein [Bacteroidales bacterium]|nr:PCMD domain-containing protein [Bacteroidales bacterium]MBR5703027.1 PCMD domain-containing protein [Bacteroidales bacterium]